MLPVPVRLALIADIVGFGHRVTMRRRRPNRYDYGFSVLGVVLCYLFLVLGRQQAWPTWQSISLIVAASVPSGLALDWLNGRLRAASRNGS
jgi:hypothetical protein